MHHESVLLLECLKALDLTQRSVIVDATLGLGGHSEAILSSKDFKGSIIGLDQDPHHLEYAEKRLKSFGERFKAFHINFRNLALLVSEESLVFDGILFDLGVASPHFDDPKRGFTFRQDSPLDMRMNPHDKMTASDIINTFSFEELCRLFREYGEEPKAVAIARRIVTERVSVPFSSTSQLSQLICDLYASQNLKNHPATKVFQALRIAVNDELTALGLALESAIECLVAGGRIIVISYHSLEDRITKKIFKDSENPCTCPPKLPLCSCGKKSRLKRIYKSPILPSSQEVSRNPRARSAKLRVAEKL